MLNIWIFYVLLVICRYTLLQHTKVSCGFKLECYLFFRKLWKFSSKSNCLIGSWSVSRSYTSHLQATILFAKSVTSTKNQSSFSPKHLSRGFLDASWPVHKFQLRDYCTRKLNTMFNKVKPSHFGSCSKIREMWTSNCCQNRQQRSSKLPKGIEWVYCSELNRPIKELPGLISLVLSAINTETEHWLIQRFKQFFRMFQNW